MLGFGTLLVEFESVFSCLNSLHSLYSSKQFLILEERQDGGQKGRIRKKEEAARRNEEGQRREEKGNNKLIVGDNVRLFNSGCEFIFNPRPLSMV